MARDLVGSPPSPLLQPTTKQYHTFQVVNPKKTSSRGIITKIATFFNESSPSSSSTAITDTYASSTTKDTVHRYNIDCPTQKTFYLFYFNILSCSISFTLTIPSLWYYLNELQCTDAYLAFCIAIYAMGELCGSYVASMIQNKYNTKFLLILSVSLGTIGGFVYATAGLLHYYYAPYSLLLGRTLQGVWTGIEQFTETKYISDNVDTKQHLNELTTISFVSCIGFILGPLFGLIFQFIHINIGSLSITGNMLCGYFIMTLCAVQLLMTLLIFDNKRRIDVPNRPEYTRTLTIQRRNVNVTTPSVPLPSDTTPLKYKLQLLLNDITRDTVMSPPPPSRHGTGFCPKKQRSKKHNGYKTDDVLNFDSASPISSRRWLDSASPPSRFGCSYNNSEIDRINVNTETRTRINTGSYLSVGSEATFHRTSVADLLNINTPSAFCTPYAPPTPRPFQEINPLQLQIRDVSMDPDAEHNIRIKYIRTHTSFNKCASVAMTFCFLIHFEAFSIQQTMTSYMIYRQFGWNVTFAHFLFILCGIIWMSSFYVVNNLLIVRSVTHNALVQMSLIMGVVSTCCLLTVTLFPELFYNGYLYIFGFVLISFTFPFGRASVLSLYCLCTNCEYVEWIYLMSMIARIVTPFVGVALFRTNDVTSWMYGNVTVLFMIAVVLCSLTTSSAKKQKIETKTNVIHHGYSIINIPQIFYIAE